jgi:hypothetical protein
MNTDTWAERHNAIEKAFRNLKIQKSTSSTGIPYDSLIGDIPRQLLLMTPIASANLRKPNQAIQKLRRHCEGLIDAIEHSPPEVINAAGIRKGYLRSLPTELRLLRLALNEAHLEPQKGAPEKRQERAIALMVAQHYYGLTGKKVTVPKKDGVAYGPFVELLTEVYNALGVCASAEAQADYISRKWASVLEQFPL